MNERVPTVRSFEYVFALLKSIKHKGRYDLEAAKETLARVKLRFEEEKIKALGKGKALTLEKEKERTKNFVLECLRLCKATILVKEVNKDMILNTFAERILKSEQPLRDIGIKKLLIERLLSAYGYFSDVLFSIREQKEGKLILPLKREGRLFKVFAEQYKLNVSQWNFEMIRDLCTELELLNWRVMPKRQYTTYAIASMVKLSEVKKLKANTSFKGFCIASCARDLRLTAEASEQEILRKAEAKDYLTVKIREDYLLIKNFAVDRQEFEQKLWEEYLKLCDYVPNSPVFYFELRDIICEELRISDRVFDDNIRKMSLFRDDYKVKVYPGGGAVPYNRVASVMRKKLPLKTGSDEFMTFLRLVKEED